MCSSDLSHCVAKPIDFAVLTQVMAGLLKQQAAPLPVLSAEQLYEYGEIRNAFAHSLPERLMLLNQAISARDWDELGRLAHSLKGTAGSFGYHGVTHAARELEQAAKHGDMAMALTLVQNITQRAQSPAHLQT